jgi:hypothetical protein
MASPTGAELQQRLVHNKVWQFMRVGHGMACSQEYGVLLHVELQPQIYLEVLIELRSKGCRAKPH